jgi:hypothetical protein
MIGHAGVAGFDFGQPILFRFRVKMTAWDVVILAAENLVPKLVPDSTELSRTPWT